MARSKTYQMLMKISGDSSSLKKACEAASEHLNTLGNAAKAAGKVLATAMAGIGTAAAGIAVAATSVYTEHEKAANSLAAATGATGKELENLQSAMETVYQNNFGESIEDAASAVSLVSRNIKGLSNQEITGATEAAIALRDAFEYDVEESTRAAAAIRKNFGGSAEEAFGLIAAGAQNGLDYSGELIDTINEYSSQFSKLGFSADGMFQLLQSGADSTAWNLDKVGDAVKEFSIRAIDGSNTTVAAFEALGYNAATMMDTFAAGGDGANQAFFDVLNTLMDMEDQVARDALGVSLFGTMWEDLGTEAMEAMANASAGAYDTMDALEQINAIRVVQRSTCDNALVPMLGRGLIYDNGACLEGKGVDRSMDRLTAHLQQFYRANGFSNDGWAVVFDFSGYFDNILHRECFNVYSRAFRDRRILRLLKDFVIPFGYPTATTNWQRVKRQDAEQYTGKSLGLGSQISQITAVSYPNSLDHFIKQVLRVRWYARYMDDGYMLFRTKKEAKEAVGLVISFCEPLGISVNQRKTRIVPIRHGFKFLKAKHRLTETGKVERRMCRESITRQRRRLKKFAAKVAAGEMTVEDAATAYGSWKGYALHRGGRKAVQRMDKLFRELFGAAAPRCKLQ